ncbi:MAG: bifunctional glutamate N-acetyltransferase/amino-acid acetyltransferase ArgJ [Maricaulaceae bacterium]
MSHLSISPLAPKRHVNLPPIAGIDMAAFASGERYKDRLDLWALRGIAGTQVAGVFTKNTIPGVPVTWSKRALTSATDGPRLVIVNAGRANVFTGEAGEAFAHETAKKAAELLGGTSQTVLLASTGIIGQCPNIGPIVAGLETISNAMTSDGWADGAEAIRTTDTFAKLATIETDISGVPVRINGIAKGSGMVMPDMATMLAFIATDARLSQSTLQALLQEATDSSFNSITVDSDSSTSDTVILMASGAASHDLIDNPSARELNNFKQALLELMQDLAKQIVRDGEGATKFIEVKIEQARTAKEARRFALSIANSPLVKTAMAGGDANWGRLMMAIGKTNIPIDSQNISLYFGPHCVASGGAIHPDYSENIGATYMKNQDLQLTVNLGEGEGCATIWTCDLTHGYIDINADYRS